MSKASVTDKMAAAALAKAAVYWEWLGAAIADDSHEEADRYSDAFHAAVAIVGGADAIRDTLEAIRKSPALQGVAWRSARAEGWCLPAIVLHAYGLGWRDVPPVIVTEPKSINVVPCRARAGQRAH